MRSARCIGRDGSFRQLRVRFSQRKPEAGVWMGLSDDVPALRLPGAGMEGLRCRSMLDLLGSFGRPVRAAHFRLCASRRASGRGCRF